jgi:hypothetical protein
MAPNPTPQTGTDPAAFIARWQKSGAAERANYQLFLSELCDLLGVPRPDPTTPDDAANAYVFERAVTFHHGDGTTSTGRIDLYRRHGFVLEAKQGADTVAPSLLRETPASYTTRKGMARRGSVAWDDAMLRARGQAEQYARALPPAEGRPPFLLVVDVGHSIEVYAEFSRSGGTYTPFPAAGSHRIFLADLAKPETRARLAQIWTDPLELDPARRAARVTREIASRLAALAVSLEAAGHPPQAAAAFLMRALFTMFAEDVGLLLKGGFTRLLESLLDTPEQFVPVVEELWDRMNRGGFSVSLRINILQFNGGLFADASALPLDRDQLALLLEASRSDWRDVEPAIFGTLLERALDPIDRHKLGAHYTPRAYVERLVLPTVVAPLRAAWDASRAAAVTLANAGDTTKAAAEVRRFHRQLCETRILDPACGTGNFLYVTLEHLKRIEGEVFDTLDSLGERQAVLEMHGETVDPHQLLGLEINPRAAAIAELVLWIGTLQWHFRNHGSVRPSQPIIRNFKNIECRDALIAYDAVEPVLDPAGQPVTRWDGRTTKPHPVTGREVPDEAARVPVVRYINPRPAVWPAADYIVGNPPFIGAKYIRASLGDGYAEAVRSVHSDVPESSDFVMYWWHHAADLVNAGQLRRFGFVTTNSLRQTFNRRVLKTHMAARNPKSEVRDPKSPTTDLGHPTSDLGPLSILFAIPDHPWVDATDGAAVRIAMTVAGVDEGEGTLWQVSDEQESGRDDYDVTFATQKGRIHADLTIGTNVAGVVALTANSEISSRGSELGGSGFVVSPVEARQLGLGNVPGLEKHIRFYRHGRDVTDTPRDIMVIDLFGLTEEEVRQRFPAVYQRIVERVKPEREQNRDTLLQGQWWLHRRLREDLRTMLSGLPRYIATPVTAKHRFFIFLDGFVMPDDALVVVASPDAWLLGVLSSTVHCIWTRATCSTLEDRPRYVKTSCFEPFPFPAVTPAQTTRIRALAEELDAHRKRQQAAHPGLTLTGMYNVLEKLRSGEPLTAKEKGIHEQGLVSVLKQLHDDLDAAVFDAYGWSDLLAHAPALRACGAAEAASRLPAKAGTLTESAGVPPSGGSSSGLQPLSATILTRLVALNAARAAEESAGQIRWLRPDYQQKSETRTQQPETTQTELALPTHKPRRVPDSALRAPRSALPWPSTLPDQVRALRSALETAAGPITPEALVTRFKRAKPDRIAELLETLVIVGHARKLPDGRYTAKI